jgi:alpha-mannosidase
MSLTLHMVPHTHWDREWYLPYQVFRIRLVHLMDRLLDILGSNGAYRHFMLDGQSILLEDYLEIRPERGGRDLSLRASGAALHRPVVCTAR